MGVRLQKGLQRGNQSGIYPIRALPFGALSLPHQSSDYGSFCLGQALRP